MKKVIALLLISLSLCACEQKNSNSQHVDEFYTNRGEFDLSRFPLIKPYEISTSIPSHDWIISSVDTNEVLGTIPGTRYINVIDSVIVAESENTIVDGQRVNNGWFVIIPKHHIFRGFKTRQEYSKYLSSIRIHDPKLFEVNEVFQYFDSKGTLNWQELNSKY